MQRSPQVATKHVGVNITPIKYQMPGIKYEISGTHHQQVHRHDIYGEERVNNGIRLNQTEIEKYISRTTI